MSDPLTPPAPVRQVGPRPDTVKVIYVMGAGRSGSTILGVTLGNCHDVFYAGELDKWLLRAGAPQRAGEERARFWESVRDQVDGAQELFGYEMLLLERSSSLFRIHRWRALRRLSGPYRRAAAELYRAVACVTGASHIVDTSHYPLRAWELQALNEIELHLLFLVRDPQGVVASFGRPDVRERSFGMLTTNLYLWLTYLVSLAVFMRHPRERRLLVRHEDFVADPQNAVRQILDRVGSGSGPLNLSALKTGMPFQGNRLIDEDVIALEHRPASPARRSLTTAIAQLPWRIVFALLKPRLTTRTGSHTLR